MKNLSIYNSIFLLFLIIISACGEPAVDVESIEYVPKIAVEAFIYPGENIEGIRIQRNFRLNEKVTEDGLFLTPQANNVVASINGNPLSFDPVTKTYYLDNSIAEFDKEYTIEIYATVDSKQLSATGKTRTPQSGFKLLEKNLGSFSYQGDLPILEFTPSTSTDFYIFSIIANNAGIDNFIYDNNIEPNMSVKDLEDNFNSYFLQYNWLSHLDPKYKGTFFYDIKDFDVWFYSDYRVIAYAGDYNFRQFHQTNFELKEIDGNFHEPYQIFTGDGIGIFASAIRDTAYFTLTR